MTISVNQIFSETSSESKERDIFNQNYRNQGLSIHSNASTQQFFQHPDDQNQ